MLIQIASDLHLDARRHRFPGESLLAAATRADLLVLAGDIHLGAHAVDIFAGWPVPVVYVSGNHEAYGSEYAEVVADIGRCSAGTQVHYLERRSVVFGAARFPGCCLWTDYALYGDLACSMAYAREANTDHAAIRVQGGAPFGPEEALAEHRRAVSWLEGSARVVANPRGYPLNLAAAQGAAQLQWENAAFDPACVVEV